MKASQAWMVAAGVCLLGIAACSGGGDGNAVTGSPSDAESGTGSTTTSTIQGSAYAITNLVSDGAVPADSVDKDLKNPWGIAFDPLGPTWLADNGTNLSTLYVDIFSGEGGTIAAWSDLTLGNLDMGAETMVDNGPAGAVYTGLALAKNGSADFLYATDFHNARIDVFDSSFKPATAAGGFVDPALPAGYAPFGIQAVGDQLYITYAPQQGPQNQHEMVGPGLGLVDLFGADGTLVRRVATGGVLNAPWGIALAPANFGQFGKDLLIGNFGDGTINAFDPVTGQFIDSLRDASGKPLSIPGLWGIAFGNSLLAVSNWLYFAAGINDRADGLYGRIVASPAAVSGSSSSGG